MDVGPLQKQSFCSQLLKHRGTGWPKIHGSYCFTSFSLFRLASLLLLACHLVKFILLLGGIDDYCKFMYWLVIRVDLQHIS